MASKTELERLAAMAHALRPDWPARSVLTYLERDQAMKAYRDLAVALAHIAADPDTRNPKRLSEPGPWWRLTTDTTEDMRARRCPQPGHTSYLADNCGACRSERVARDEPVPLPARASNALPPERIRQILAAAGMPGAPTEPDARTGAAGDDREAVS